MPNKKIKKGLKTYDPRYMNLYTLATADGGDVEAPDCGHTRLFYSEDEAKQYWEKHVKRPIEEINIIEWAMVRTFGQAHKGRNKDMLKWRKA